VGECTITLDDVAFQLGLRVDGKQMTGLTYVDCEDMCRTYLGVIPQKCDAIVGSMIKLKWLCDHMSPLSEQQL